MTGSFTTEADMLVLSRKKHESVIINGNIRVMLIDIRGDKVRLGIECPREISVHREEVELQIKREREQQRCTQQPHN